MIELRGLDLFCRAGGATRGYLDAARQYGEVELKMVGVDVLNKERQYQRSGGYHFIRGNALECLDDPGYVATFDFIHASPPCHIFSQLGELRKGQGNKSGAEDWLTPLRPYMERYSNKPWIIENVERCDIMRADLLLCGSQFPHLRGVHDMRRQLRRHRKFELHGFEVPYLYCQHNGIRPLGVYGVRNEHIPGGASTAADLNEGRKLMGIDWMEWKDLVEAIPPAYTQHIGKYMIPELINRRAA